MTSKRNPIAKALRQPLFHKRVIKNKKKYVRRTKYCSVDSVNKLGTFI